MKNNRDETLTLEILTAVEAQNDVTQRHLADRLGVALGLANSYMRRCVRKGWVKINQAPANRYLYYLTPKGFAEKSRLTAEYLSSSFEFYRQAGQALSETFLDARRRGAIQVLFGGVSELAEIGYLRLSDHSLTLAGTFDPYSELSQFLGCPVWKSMDRCNHFDVAIVTALVEAPEIYTEISRQAGGECVYVPATVQPLIPHQLV